MPAKIDPNKCTGQKACIEVCPVQAITFDEGSKKSTVDAEKCVSCGACVSACPQQAITME